MKRLALAIALSASSGCTLLTSFNPDGQPCDMTASNPANECLQGYGCVQGKCKKGAANDVPDAGP